MCSSIRIDYIIPWADQGSGKTRFFFQLLNELAEAGEKCLFVSMEEHPESELFIEKRNQYISKKAIPNLFVLGGVSGENARQSLYELTPHFNVVAVDSWGKLEGLSLDDFRRSFDGKFFPIIYQRTGTGSMRGGSAAQFDADIVAKVKKDPEGDYQLNYVFFDKNRYQDKVGMKYFISSGKIEQHTPE